MKKYLLCISALFIAISCDTNQEQHSNHNDQHDEMLALTEPEKVMANIKIDTAQVKTLFQEVTLIGTATADATRLNILSARVKGRLDELFVRNPGQFVRKGDPLYSIYSEELLAHQNEYLLSIDQDKTATTEKEITQNMVRAAKKRLKRWTLTDNQIRDLETTRDISPLVTFYSNREGYLSELLVREGEYVELGAPLFQLADLKSVWIEAQLYSNEIRLLRQSPSLEVVFEAFPDEQAHGEVVFTNPGLEENSKINIVRIRVNNHKGKYKPGMMAYVHIKTNKKQTLVIPKSALLLENFTSVWVETADGMYAQRMVETGISNKREVEIISGLSPGEKVVSSGAYLLNSAWKVKQGGGGMQGMDM